MHCSIFAGSKTAITKQSMAMMAKSIITTTAMWAGQNGGGVTAADVPAQCGIASSIKPANG